MISLALVFTLVASAAPATIAERLLAKKKCAPVKGDENTLMCTYEIGSFQLEIVGVGDPMASINFVHSDANDDYWGVVGLAHGCILVKPGRKTEPNLDMAFISPVNGKVYAHWPECGAARKR